MPKIVDHSIFIDAAITKFGKIDTISRQQILEVCEEANIKYPTWLTNVQTYRAGRGMYTLPKSKTQTKKIAPVAPVVTNTPELATVDMAIAAVKMDTPDQVSLVPDKAPGYVPFGNFNDVRSIIKSKRFYPVYITGLSGNGKTMMVEQVCATEKRECIRVNITIETDEEIGRAHV